MAATRGTTQFDADLGKAIRKRRLELGVSQEKLAALVGVTFQQLQKYEGGVNRLAAERLFVVARCLNTTAGELAETAVRRRFGKARLGV